MKFKDYCFNVAVALDQFINALIGGHPDETMSSRCYRNSQKYWYAKAAQRFLDFIFSPWGSDHCKQAYESELKRSQLFNVAGISR